MKPSEHLALARDEIERGWTRGTLQDYMGNVCSAMALERIAQQTQPQGLDAFVETCAVGNAAAAALEKVTLELGGKSIVRFNDSATSKLDVLTAFEKAICQLEERGE